jgi:protein TonB
MSARTMLPQTTVATNAAPRETTAPAAKNPAISASTYYEGAQLDVPPHLLGEVQQVYPARARAADIEGSVTLSLLIDAHGKVDHVSVVSAQPRGYFEQAALDMLRSQRFTPALIHNQPVKSRWHTVVRYRLQS